MGGLLSAPSSCPVSRCHATANFGAGGAPEMPPGSDTVSLMPPVPHPQNRRSRTWADRINWRAG